MVGTTSDLWKWKLQIFGGKFCDVLDVIVRESIETDLYPFEANLVCMNHYSFPSILFVVHEAMSCVFTLLRL